MYSELNIAREAVCERHRQVESERMYRQLIAARRWQRKADRAGARARRALLGHPVTPADRTRSPGLPTETGASVMSRLRSCRCRPATTPRTSATPASRSRALQVLLRDDLAHIVDLVCWRDGALVHVADSTGHSTLTAAA